MSPAEKVEKARDELSEALGHALRAIPDTLLPFGLQSKAVDTMVALEHIIIKLKGYDYD